MAHLYWPFPRNHRQAFKILVRKNVSVQNHVLHSADSDGEIQMVSQFSSSIIYVLGVSKDSTNHSVRRWFRTSGLFIDDGMQSGPHEVVPWRLGLQKLRFYLQFGHKLPWQVKDDSFLFVSWASPRPIFVPWLDCCKKSLVPVVVLATDHPFISGSLFWYLVQ